MDKRPIGIFDSGLGGLTALSRLSHLLPDENYIYLGDTLRVPYGDKTRPELLKCAEDDFKFLLKNKVKAIIIACGTVSSNLSCEDFEKIPVLCKGVIAPAAQKAVETTKNNKIGIIATAASIRAGAFKRVINSLCADAEVFDVACPDFVPLIERGKTSKNDPEVKEAVKKYLTPLKENGVDTLILGCTHYPLLSDAIKEFLPDAALIDSGAEAAEDMALALKNADLLSGEQIGGQSFFVTSNAEGFKQNAAIFLKKEIDSVTEITL